MTQMTSNNSSTTFPHQWVHLSDCLSACSKHTMVHYNNALWVFGGDDGGRSMSNQLLKYDIATDTWSRPSCRGTFPAARYHHTAVVWGDKMIIFGGYTGDLPSSPNLTNKNDMFEYHFPTGEWREWHLAPGAQAPSPRSAHGAAVYDNKMWIYGGYDGNCRLNDMWYVALSHSGTPVSTAGYLSSHNLMSNIVNDHANNLSTPAGSSAASFSSPSSGPGGGIQLAPHESHCQCVACDPNVNFIRPLGHGNHSEALLGENSVVSPPMAPVPRSWTQVHQLGEQPPSCCNFAMCVLADFMYLFSGHSAVSYNNKLYRFHFAQQTWTRINSNYVLSAGALAPEKRYGHIMVAYESSLYIFGGATGKPALLNELHRFDTATQSWSVENSQQSLLLRSEMVASTSSNSSPPQTSTVSSSQSGIIPSRRLFHAACCVHDTLYIMGGTLDNNRRSAELFRCQLADYPPCSLRHDLGLLLKNSPQYCDVVFKLGNDDHVPCFTSSEMEEEERVDLMSGGQVEDTHHGGGEVAAHCAVVVSRCPYLREMIRETRIKTTVTPQNGILSVPLAGVSNATAFRLILNYLYTDRIVPTRPEAVLHMDHTLDISLVEPPDAVVIALMIDVYFLALKFGLTRLRQLFSQYFDFVITCENVLPALHKATQMRLHALQQRLLRFIVKDSHYARILHMDQFATLPKNLIVNIARHRETPHLITPTTGNTNSNVALDEVVCEWPCEEKSLEEDLAQLLHTPLGAEFSDLILQLVSNNGSNSVEEESAASSQLDFCFPAHRSILAARSEYFRGLFRTREFREGRDCAVVKIDGVGPVQLGRSISSNTTTESTSTSGGGGDVAEVPLEEMQWPTLPVSTFRSLMQFLYTGQAAVLSPEDALFLIHVPNYYGLTNTRLQALYKRELEANICFDNVANILAVSDRVQAISMKRFSLDLIASDPRRALPSPRSTLENLPHHLLVELIEALVESWPYPPCSGCSSRLCSYMGNMATPSEESQSGQQQHFGASGNIKRHYSHMPTTSPNNSAIPRNFHRQSQASGTQSLRLNSSSTTTGLGNQPTNRNRSQMR